MQLKTLQLLFVYKVVYILFAGTSHLRSFLRVHAGAKQVVCLQRIHPIIVKLIM
jgi:hypothetical protein